MDNGRIMLEIDDVEQETTSTEAVAEDVSTEKEITLESEGETSAEQSEGEANGEAEVEEKNKESFYSPEEIEDMLRRSEDGEDVKINFDRLTPEGKAIWKSVDRGLKPKLQERAELKRRLEVLEANAQKYEQQAKTSADPKEQYYTQYKNDPVGFTDLVNREIERLKESDDIYESTKQITSLQAALNSFHAKYNKEQSEAYKQREVMESVNRLSAETENALQKDIPEFVKVRDELTKFAVENMGYTMEELGNLTNPAVVGKDLAVKNTKVVYSAYVNSKKLSDKTSIVAQKTVKAVAPKVESAGTGLKAQTEKVWTDDDSIKELIANQL